MEYFTQGLASWNSLLTKCISDDYIKEGDRGEKCGSFEGNQYVRRTSNENPKSKHCLDEIERGGRIILIWI